MEDIDGISRRQRRPMNYSTGTRLRWYRQRIRLHRHPHLRHRSQRPTASDSQRRRDSR